METEVPTREYYIVPEQTVSGIEAILVDPWMGWNSLVQREMNAGNIDIVDEQKTNYEFFDCDYHSGQPYQSDSATGIEFKPELCTPEMKVALELGSAIDASGSRSNANLEHITNDIEQFHVHIPDSAHEDNTILFNSCSTSNAAQTRHLRTTNTVVRGLPRVLINRLSSDRQKQYVCSHCDSIYANKSDFVVHAKNYDVRGNSCLCAHCERVLRNKTNLIRHVRKQHDFKLVSCVQCEETFISERMLIKHRKRHQESRVKRVDASKSARHPVTSRQPTLPCDDQYRIRNVDNLHPCAHCEMKFEFKVDLMLHEVCHKEKSALPDKEKRYTCPLCGKTVRCLRRSIRQHLAIHTGEKFYQCDACLYASTRLMHIKSHKLIQHEGVKPFKCDQCDRAFGSKCEVRNHVFLHVDARHFKCTLCPKAYHRQNSLREHVKLHSATRPFKCDQCNASFNTRVILKRHVNLVHLKTETPVACNICSKVYSSEKNLSLHTRVVHTDEKNFFCSHCNAGFALKCYLIVHMLRHGFESQSVAAKCKECNKRFVSKASLRVHRINHHREKRFVCEQCGAVFARADYLRKHMLKHTREKSYLCARCGATFSREDNMKAHERRHKPNARKK